MIYLIRISFHPFSPFRPSFLLIILSRNLVPFDKFSSRDSLILSIMFVFPAKSSWTATYFVH